MISYKKQNSCILKISALRCIAKKSPEAKSKDPDWGMKSQLWRRVKVDSGIGLPIVNVLESTLEWT